MTNRNSVQPYLFFGGRCEEALEFYQRALGAEIEMLSRFKDAPAEAGCPDNWTRKVMHASIRIGTTSFLASDGCWTETASGFKGFALSVTAADEQEAEQRFAALAKDGEVRMPLQKTFFATRFGMVCDRYGVSWMIVVPAEEAVAGRKLESAVCQA